ncbi:MAG: hypothetical protein M1598_08855 [Actinobacteria bacterium]|nr:hypothetical protein [Actinomycetota bacterium]
MDGILRELVPLAAEVVVTRVNYVRALDVNELARRVSAFGIEPKITNNAAQGVDEALRLAGPEDLVLCTGSLYLVGELRAILKEPSGKMAGPP